MITQEAVVDIARDAIYTIIITSAPLLLVSLIVGLIISIFQTVTSIQEQTLTFVPKILAVFVTMMICGSWKLDNMSNFMIYGQNSATSLVWGNYGRYFIFYRKFRILFTYSGSYCIVYFCGTVFWR